ncbi:MAG: hypothetical protein E7438_01440 [Ruminococcaceae bacterium]|nr:hypothetical protein [Oscillospiraceae bacterium]
MKEILITSSVLIVVLLILRLIFAKKVSRVLIYGAWGLVALRLLIPVQIGQLDFSILTSAKPVTEAITEVSNKQVAGVTEQDAYREIIKDYVEKDQTVFTPEVQAHIQSAIRDQMPKEEIAVMIDKIYTEQEVFVPEVRPQVQQQVADTADPITLGQIAAAVWLAGVGVMAVWFAIVNLRHSRMLRKNREKLDVESPIPVYVSEKVGSPCLVGLFRPAVYLTPACAAEETTQRHVLTHELTHWRHADHIWSLARCVCLCVYWFNPLVWVAAWFSRRDCELACDEGALKRLGEAERIAYGKSLLDVVSQASRPANLMQTATAMNETKKQLKERVNFIVKKRKISLIAAVCMVVLCAIVAGCAAAGPVASSDNWERMKRQIQEDAVAFFSTETDTCQPEEVELRLISQFDDTYVMFVDMPFLGYLACITTEEINGLEFVYPSSQKMWVYKDGGFTMLKEAFETGLISAKQLETVWEDYTTYHEQNLETSKPDLQDPTGSTPPKNDPDTSWQTGIGASISFKTNTVDAKVFPEDDYGNGYPIALIINAKAGIEAHLSRLGYPEYLEIMEAAEQYDDAFFESHSLILVWNSPGSSSDTYRVNSLHRIAEDEIEIGMCKEITSDGTQDLVSKLIFVETSKKIPEKTVCNVNCSTHRDQVPPQVSLLAGEQVLKPRRCGYGWGNNCGAVNVDGVFGGKGTNYAEEYPWLYTSQRSVLLESPVAPQWITVECWDVSNWDSDSFEIYSEELKVENGSIPLKVGTYYYFVKVEWSAWYTDREFGSGKAYYGFVAQVPDGSGNDRPTKPGDAVFNTENIVRITFYAYCGQGKGSDVPAENMEEIINWLNSFTVGVKGPDVLPPGSGTYQVEIEYADGTVIKRSLDTITINGVIYYLKAEQHPEILEEIFSKVSL